tara:strand:+ start:914 stop:1087 length:174 start_codon:yes stop_codon:yes gene_type:complete
MHTICEDQLLSAAKAVSRINRDISNYVTDLRTKKKGGIALFLFMGSINYPYYQEIGN